MRHWAQVLSRQNGVGAIQSVFIMHCTHASPTQNGVGELQFEFAVHATQRCAIVSQIGRPVLPPH
jgi:hypothetical protein